ncbi:MAG: hypothetical protein ACD_75C02141G0002 [uncultured bacterium]|nr:MAG: hypothetical protein ACD_75C02141G0002 [uncultured bacterium]
MPVGDSVSAELWLPGTFMVWYRRSWKSALLFLKPEVLTLARLLAITSIFSCWLCMPVVPVQSERIIVYPYSLLRSFCF